MNKLKEMAQILIMHIFKDKENENEKNILLDFIDVI